MAKTNESPEAAQAAPEIVFIELNEFCARLSESRFAPELFGAFASVERAAGNVKDTEAAFQSRFDAFCVKPV